MIGALALLVVIGVGGLRLVMLPGGPSLPERMVLTLDLREGLEEVAGTDPLAALAVGWQPSLGRRGHGARPGGRGRAGRGPAGAPRRRGPGLCPAAGAARRRAAVSRRRASRRRPCRRLRRVRPRQWRLLSGERVRAHRPAAGGHARPHRPDPGGAARPRPAGQARRPAGRRSPRRLQDHLRHLRRIRDDARAPRIPAVPGGLARRAAPAGPGRGPRPRAAGGRAS